MTTSRGNQQKVISIGAPVLVGIGVIVIWELAVQFWQIPKYLLPAPRDILQALIENRAELARATLSTLSVTIKSFLLSIVIGALTAFIFVQSRAIEICLFPFAILLQVTPLVAIAPLIIILVKDTHTSLIICTILIAIFPIISNTTVGLHSVDTDLLNYFRMSKASRFQDPDAPTHPGGAALFHGRPQDFERPCSNWRNRRRICRGNRWPRRRTCLRDPFGGLSARNSANVRVARADWNHGRAAVRDDEPDHAPAAR